MIRELAHLLDPWKSAFADSKLISTMVTGTHILALLIGGGLAIAADRATLRVLRRPEVERRHDLDELHAVHRPVMIGLVVLAVSGVLLAAADFETFVTSPIFWVKMALVAALLANGVILYSTEVWLNRDLAAGALPKEALWNRLRRATWASLSLWLLTTVGGSVLTGMS